MPVDDAILLMRAWPLERRERARRAAMNIRRSSEVNWAERRAAKGEGGSSKSRSWPSWRVHSVTGLRRKPKVSPSHGGQEGVEVEGRWRSSTKLRGQGTRDEVGSWREGGSWRRKPTRQHDAWSRSSDIQMQQAECLLRERYLLLALDKDSERFDRESGERDGRWDERNLFVSSELPPSATRLEPAPREADRLLRLDHLHSTGSQFASPTISSTVIPCPGSLESALLSEISSSPASRLRCRTSCAQRQAE